MTSVKGIYENGRVTLAEPIPAAGPLEVGVYEEKALDSETRRALTFVNYDVPMTNPAERFDRQTLY